MSQIGPRGEFSRYLSELLRFGRPTQIIRM
jgi:hypothetical protein